MTQRALGVLGNNKVLLLHLSMAKLPKKVSKQVSDVTFYFNEISFINSTGQSVETFCSGQCQDASDFSPGPFSKNTTI